MHRNRAQWVAGWTGVTVILLAAAALWVSGIARDATALALAETTLILGAAFIWGWYCRPRLVVTSSHVTVVNELRTYRFGWDQLDAFEAQRVLFVIPVTGNPVPVAGLPAGGVRRVLLGRPGEVDRVVRDLNANLAAITGKPAT